MVETPRIVHRAWMGGPEPEWTRPFAATWAAMPGWTLEEWTDERIEDELFPLANQAIWDAAPVVAPRHVGQLRSDVLRYEVLLRHGGVWVDADFECLRPIDGLVGSIPTMPWVAWEEQGVWLNNAIMGGPAGDPFFEDLVGGLLRNVLDNLGSKPNKLSGPQYLTRVKHAGHETSVVAIPQKHFYPFSWSEVELYEPGTFDAAELWPEAYAVHWWRNKRHERGIEPA